MEDWFELLQETLGMAANLAECIGAIFLFSQLRRPLKPPLKSRKYEEE